MARAKLTLRENWHLIIEVHDEGHVSIQEVIAGHARQPTVLSANKADKLARWLIKHNKPSSAQHYDPVVEAAKKRRR